MEIYTKDVQLPKRTCCSTCVWGIWSSNQKLNDVGYQDSNTWDLELTAESVVVWNSKDLKRNARHLRRQEIV